MCVCGAGSTHEQSKSACKQSSEHMQAEQQQGAEQQSQGASSSKEHGAHVWASQWLYRTAALPVSNHAHAHDIEFQFG